MTEIVQDARTAQQVHTRALIVPREHGAWGLLLIPLFTGIAASFASAKQVWPLLVFTVAALALFWLRTPVESLLGTGLLTAQTSRERRTALIASCLLAAVATVCLAAVMWNGRALTLLLLGTVTALSVAIQAGLRKLGRWARMPAQLVGTIGLTCAAPAAYYVGTGHLDRRAFALWGANWIFAGNQIHFVQLRIHNARAATFSEKFARGRAFFLAQPMLLVALAFASIGRWVPALAMFAFVPVLVRGSLWFFRGPESLNVRGLGWSEMRQGMVFGILLAIAFIVSS